MRMRKTSLKKHFQQIERDSEAKIISAMHGRKINFKGMGHAAKALQ